MIVEEQLSEPSETSMTLQPEAKFQHVHGDDAESSISNDRGDINQHADYFIAKVRLPSCGENLHAYMYMCFWVQLASSTMLFLLFFKFLVAFEVAIE